MKSKKIKEHAAFGKTKGEKLFDVCNYIFLIALAAIFLIPFYTTIMTSFISEAERLERGMFILWPHKFDFSAYKAVMGKNSGIYSGFMITLGRTIIGTFLSMLITAMAAYTLAKRDLPARKVLTFIIYFTMLFNGGMVPTYLVIKFTHLIDSFWALVIPGLVSVWNLFLLRNFFMQIPETFEEAAILDGATPLKIFLRIVVPLSVSSFATIAMFYAVWHWNSWFDGIIYINSRELQPMQVVLRNIISASNVESMVDSAMSTPPPLESVKGATIIVSTLPILCVYPFVQKYFVKGVMVGGVKG